MSIQSYLSSLKQSGIERKIPNISEANALFITSLIREKKPKHLLEIGTANGYSTLCFAQTLKEIWEGDIVTIEHTPSAFEEAKTHFSACDMDSYIAPLLWDALTIIPTLPDRKYDFIFIDAMKKSYLDYFLLIQTKLQKPATIVIDDVKKFRHKMENLYTYLDEHSILHTLHEVDEDDATMVIVVE